MSLTLQDLLSDCLGRFRAERREIESRLFEHGTMEERKWVIRAFVEGLTIDGSSQSGEVRMKKLPVPEPRSTRSSFDLVAGPRYKAIHDAMGERLVSFLLLPRRGRSVHLQCGAPHLLQRLPDPLPDRPEERVRTLESEGKRDSGTREVGGL